ncbi:unnamed protein product [Miscanthus lutarioriparius]|uniref:Uncharacterized protein n=1 Tax=Miscanthus lutarioriparius TaxID=422564 RepID=A0A811MA08_9POAL|nr:unnamed protein product [Miscanthus lutarioriparius]
MHMPPLGLGAAEAAAWETHAQPPGSLTLSQSQGHDSTFLGWIIGGDADDVAMPGVMDDHHSHSVLHDLDNIPSSSSSSSVLPPFQPHVVHHSSQAAFPPFVTPPKLHHNPMPAVPASPPKQTPLAAGLLKPKPEAPGTDDAATAVDQLAEAARLAEAGDVFGAREILARLNYLLPPAHAAGATATPLLRSAFYFKEALRAALSTTTTSADASSPVDVLLKLGAYKAFSELCPVLQFTHFTCVQAVLDELGGAACIHVLDFDIGVGEQWASLMQELARRRPGATLKVTALVSTASQSHHPLELQLVHENLSNFAADTRVPFQLAFFNLDAMDPSELLAITAGDAVAVHLPAGSVHAPAVPSVLHLVRRLGAKLVVSVDRSCDRGELLFAAHLFQAFQSCVFLLESLDAVGTAADVAAKIERFLIKPRIERCVAERYRAAAAGDKTPPWRAMLASAGFVPVQASSFAEAQAESLLKKVPVRGFRVEKRAGSLVLHWQRGELLSVSAWRC